jgi:hypothetical protein
LNPYSFLSLHKGQIHSSIAKAFSKPSQSLPSPSLRLTVPFKKIPKKTLGGDFATSDQETRKKI